MMGLFSDVWAVASGAGLLLCLAALPFLYKRARAASSALPGLVRAPIDVDDEPIPVVKEPAAQPAPQPVEAPAERPAAAPKDAEAALPRDSARSAKAAEPAPQPQSQAQPQPAPADRDTKTSTGGTSPAVVYMQNLKIQMEHFEKEIHQLRSQLAGFAQMHDKEFKILLQKMSEFQAELHGQVGAAHAPPAAAPIPAPAPAPAPAKAVPVAAKPAPAPAPAPKPVAAVPAPAPAIPLAKPPAAASAPAPAPAPVPVPVPKPAVQAPAPAPAPAPKPVTQPIPEKTVPVNLAAAEKTLVMPPKKADAETPEQIAAGLSLRVPGGEAQPLTPPPAEEDPAPGSKGPVWPV
ncbi:MAG: hypothetical protein HYZ75_13420 [Elusimicrobia bacterium]|nr:hypothetical protein [Elusimicrobiota bacterium]